MPARPTRQLVAERGGTASTFGASRGDGRFGGFQVETGERADVRVERRLEVGVQQDACELGEQVRVAVQGIQEFGGETAGSAAGQVMERITGGWTGAAGRTLRGVG